MRASTRTPQDTAAMQASTVKDASSLIVTVTRLSAPLRDRAEPANGVPVVHRGQRGRERSAVTVTVLPAPPVDADDSYAVDQTVTAVSAGSMRRTLTLAAQIRDVRVSATWLHEGHGKPHPMSPPTPRRWTCFTEAVLKVRRVGGP